MNRFGAGLFACVLIFQLPACQSVTTETKKYDPTKIDAAPAYGETFIEPSIGDATYLNPLLSSDSASSDINALVFNSLLTYDKNLNLEGDLAKSWSIENEGKTITFKLKPGIQWHDGKPFTSADVLFTYEKLVSTQTFTPRRSDYIIISKAEAPDPYTFRVHYDKPFSPALESWSIGIIPKHIYDKSDINTHPANRHPIGTGPYIFQEWLTDEKIILTANPHYFKGRPYFDRFVYVIIPDLSVQFLLLRQGELSIMGPTPDQYNGYDEFFINYNKFHYPSFQYSYIGLNLKHSLFQSKGVRKALSHAINKKVIINGLYEGLAVETTGPFTPSSWAYNHDVPTPAYDPELAKSMLEDAGWKDRDGDGIIDKDGKPFHFTLITNQGNKIRESIAQIVQNDFKKIGIEMNIRIIEWSVFIQKFINKRDFDAFLLGWSLSIDPDAYQIWHSSQVGEAQFNIVHYQNKEVDALLEEGRRTFGIEKRKPIYNRIHEIIADDAPYLFLVTGESLPVVHKKILGIEKAPAGIRYNFEEWYIPKAWQSPRYQS